MLCLSSRWTRILVKEKKIKKRLFCITGPFSLSHEFHQAGVVPSYLFSQTQRSRCCWAKNIKVATDTIQGLSHCNDSSAKETFVGKGRRTFQFRKHFSPSIYSHRTRKGKDGEERGGGEQSPIFWEKQIEKKKLFNIKNIFTGSADTYI